MQTKPSKTRPAVFDAVADTTAGMTIADRMAWFCSQPSMPAIRSRAKAPRRQKSPRLDLMVSRRRFVRFIRMCEIGNRMKTTEYKHSAVFILLPIAPARIHQTVTGVAKPLSQAERPGAISRSLRKTSAAGTPLTRPAS